MCELLFKMLILGSTEQHTSGNATTSLQLHSELKLCTYYNTSTLCIVCNVNAVVQVRGFYK